MKTINQAPFKPADNRVRTGSRYISQDPDGPVPAGKEKRRKGWMKGRWPGGTRGTGLCQGEGHAPAFGPG